MGFFARFLSFAALVAAVAVATLDAIRFVATAALDLVPMAAVLAWAGGDPAVTGGAGKTVLGPVLGLPAAGGFLALSLVFWVAGYRRPKPFDPFAADGGRSLWR